MTESISLSGIEDALQTIASSQQSSLTSTVIGAIISGIIVFVLGECSRELWLAPLQRYKKLKEQIAYLLIHHYKWYNDPIDLKLATTQIVVNYYNQASSDISDVAAQLFGFSETLPRFHPGIPNGRKLKTAANSLFGLANGMFLPIGAKMNPNEDTSIHVVQNEMRVEKIRNILSLDKPEEKK